RDMNHALGMPARCGDCKASVIPGRRKAASPESITPAVDLAFNASSDKPVVMDSGLAPSARPGMTNMRNLITDVPGLRVGHAQDARLGSGATAVIFDEPA